MKTKKEFQENKSFNVLKKDELMQIKGGTEEYIGGTPTVRDGDFD